MIQTQHAYALFWQQTRLTVTDSECVVLCGVMWSSDWMCSVCALATRSGLGECSKKRIVNCEKSCKRAALKRVITIINIMWWSGRFVAALHYSNIVSADGGWVRLNWLARYQNIESILTI